MAEIPHTDHPIRNYDRTCPACNETPMQGLAEFLRSQDVPGYSGPHYEKLRRWASEVEAARASPDTRSERERFEAWAHSMCMSVEREPFPTRQAYLSLATSNAWEGWKGCRASLPAPLPDGLRQGNWHHPDGGRIVGWLIPPDDVERMKADAFCLPREIGECLERLRARPAEPAPSVDVLRQDAERYRWLRDSPYEDGAAAGYRRADTIYLRHLHGEELDAAIDKELSKEKP